MRPGLVALAVSLMVLSGQAGRACDLALVLAFDVSLSVDADEYDQQARGTADALTDPAVQSVLLSVPGGVALSAMQWSGRGEQSLSVAWAHITEKSELDAFAGKLVTAPRAFGSKTAPGSAIDFARLLHRQNPTSCARSVIDMSGDGVENEGRRTRTASAQAIAEAITINGLVIVGSDDKAVDFYRHNVIGGPGSFLEISNGYGDYRRAIREKLLKEMPQMVAQSAAQ